MNFATSILEQLNEQPVRPATDDAFDCFNCTRRGSCPAGELSVSQLSMFSRYVLAARPVARGQRMIEAGEDFDGIFIVKGGLFKSYRVGPNGEMQLAGIHGPGDVFGTEGMDSGSYPHLVEALDSGSVCKVSASAFEHNASADPTIVRTLVNVLCEAARRAGEQTTGSAVSDRIPAVCH